MFPSAELQKVSQSNGAFSSKRSFYKRMKSKSCTNQNFILKTIHFNSKVCVIVQQLTQCLVVQQYRPVAKLQSRLKLTDNLFWFFQGVLWPLPFWTLDLGLPQYLDQSQDNAFQRRAQAGRQHTILTARSLTHSLAQKKCCDKSNPNSSISFLNDEYEVYKLREMIDLLLELIYTFILREFNFKTGRVLSEVARIHLDSCNDSLAEVWKAT